MKIIITESQYERVLNNGNNTNISFEDLYRNLWSKMLNVVCRKYTSDVDKARDYCQNGFLKVYKNLHKYTGQGSLEGWVRSIIKNNIIDDIRKERIDYYEDEYLYDKLEEPEEEYTEANIDHILKVIPMLPPSYRKAFELFYLDGLSHQRISELLGISVGTSKSNLSKAKVAIKNILDKTSHLDN